MLDPENQSMKDIVLKSKLCSTEKMEEILDEHLRTGRSLKDVILDFQLATEEQLLAVIAEQMNLDFVDLSDIELDQSVIDMVSGDVVRSLGVVPLDFDGYTVTAAPRNPLNYQVADELHFVLGRPVSLVVAMEAEVDALIDRYYPIDMASVHELLNEMEQEKGIRLDGDMEEAANEAPIVKFVEAVLYQAIRDKASDIHFEPFENDFKIRYRIDGALYEMVPPPKSLAVPVISRVKIISGLNISERRKPQDGRIQLKVNGKPVDMRVSTLPTQHGESVVLRVLDRSAVNLDLDVLGINENVLAKIRQMISLPNGIFIITGPTGSGKTTTLYSALKELNTVEVKILTAEDPVEYDLDGIVQLPIDEGVKMTFDRALRAFLRQDPDIIMLGETRDIESASMAVQASLTGHLVFTTLHTNDAAGAITRLVDMGVEPYLITSSLVGVLGQRLIRRVCPHCKTAFVPSDDDLALLGLEREDIGDNKFYYGRGCPVCNNTGYKGRKAITELLEMNTKIGELVLQSAPTIVINDKARELGMETMREDGIRAILNGETTMEEVLKYT